MNISQHLRGLIAHVDATAHLTGGAHAADEARAALAAHDAAVSAGAWSVRGRRVVLAPDGVVCMARDNAESARIVACVNACTGIADPGALVQAARDAVAALDSVASNGSLQHHAMAALCNALDGAA